MNWKRLVTAAILLPLLILYVMKLPAIWYAGLIALACALALIEFYTMYRIRPALRNTGVILGAAVPIAVYYGFHANALLAVFMLLATLRLFERPEPEGALADLGPLVLGLVYIPGLMGFHIKLRAVDPGLIIFLYGTVWLADAFAYYFGKAYGKRKLYPSMSPKKTWVGAVASVLGGAAGAAMLRYFLIPWMTYAHVVAMGLIIGSVAIIGDLTESMLKRDAGIKDSGTLIPGHGGFLDKMDGSLFAGPLLFWVLKGLKLI